jgi:phytoene dehydrogenase-like protein
MEKSVHNKQISFGKDLDAVVVGSGPNGLAAAITLRQAGCSVLLLEAKSKIGGGLCSEELTLPGFIHDVSSAIHPLAVQSPFFQSLSLEKHGLKYLYPEISLTHPFDDGTAIGMYKSIEDTAEEMGEDRDAYISLVKPVLENWDRLKPDILGPLNLINHPAKMLKFGLKALRSADGTSRKFKTAKARAFWGGLSVHSQLPFSFLGSSAIGLVLLAAGHDRGWPLAQGGSQSVANALASYFLSIGGTIETNYPIKNLDQLPAARAILLDVTPRQFLSIAGHRFSNIYKWQLEKYKYGMGVFKVDWALNGPTPFKNEIARKAATLHLGSLYPEMMQSELNAWNGKEILDPTLLFAQQTIVDPSRAPAGKHTAWAYCHVSAGSVTDMTNIVEKQVERFAPGFRDTILARHTMNTIQLESYNSNNIKGDIGGGANTLNQLFTRPVLRSSFYRSSLSGIYLCSSSTPPGGGVHGMCGFHAAKKALKDIFEKE